VSAKCQNANWRAIASEALKESTLSSYYDEVAMPGLEMAAHKLDRRKDPALVNQKSE
jgi:hypothetical protein